VLAAAVLALLLAAPARADIFATFDDVSVDPAQVRAVNATTGAALPLPPRVDDPQASESHPSLSPNGKYLVFKREARGTVRIVMVERATGVSRDLFSPSEASDIRPNTPTFSLDGKTVWTGGRFNCCAGANGGGFYAAVYGVDVRSFPTVRFSNIFNGRFPETQPPGGRTLQPIEWRVSGGLQTAFVYGLQYDGGNPPGRVASSKVYLGGPGLADPSGGIVADPSRQFAEPTVGGPGGQVMVFTSTPVGAPIAAQLPSRSKLVSLTLLDGPQITDLPAAVNAPNASVSNPAFSRDGRYLAFVRGGPGSRLFIWDTQTQLLLNPQGVPASPDVTEGEIALEVRAVFTGTDLTAGAVGFALARGSGTGLLVQRIVGRRRLLGRRAPKLRKVGRVPLGKFRKGRHRKRYHFTVRGHKLRPGCYLITVRALTPKKQVRDLSKPYTVRIRNHRRPRVRKGVRLRACR
jgi:WD40 repeat protein